MARGVHGHCYQVDASIETSEAFYGGNGLRAMPGAESRREIGYCINSTHGQTLTT